MPPRGPQHGVIGGDAMYGTELPQTETPEVDLSVERGMARFSRTKEFKALKQTIEQRKKYWRQFQPGANGQHIAFREMPNEERGWRSLVSDYLIEELDMLINAYETANEVVANAEKARREQRKAVPGGSGSSPTGA